VEASGVKLFRLRAMVTQSSSSLLLPTSRLRTRIFHLGGRLAHLTTFGLFPTNITTSHDQELHHHLYLSSSTMQVSRWQIDKVKRKRRRTTWTTRRRGHPVRIIACYPVRWTTVRVLWTDKTGDVSTVTVAVN
jgi:hypothetical protein